MDGDAIAGFAQLRIRVRPSCVRAASACEVQRLYVDARFHGKGVAALLMDACIDSARGHGTAALWLGVWERNLRAIAFYAKCGFVEVGEQVFPLGRDLHRDLVMARSI
jgi:ribosomal protein S18 acetylase RimI-like enzyme